MTNGLLYGVRSGLSLITSHGAQESGPQLQGRSTFRDPEKPECNSLTLYQRSASVREQGPASIFRPILQRSQTSTRRPKHTSHTAPISPRVVEKPERSPSVVRVSKGGDRSSGIFGSIFAPIAGKPSRPAKKMEPARMYVPFTIHPRALLITIETGSSA